MKKVSFFTFTLLALLSCSESNKKQSYALKPEDIAKFALYKPVKYVIDSLRLSDDNLIFVDDPPGIIRSIRIDYASSGTIEFFFGPTSIISDIPCTNKKYLIAVANKTIDEVHWKDANGKSITMKKLIVY